MTASDAFDTHPGTTQDTIAFNGLTGVMGAGWMVAAILPEKGAQDELVGMDQGDSAAT